MPIIEIYSCSVSRCRNFQDLRAYYIVTLRLNCTKSHYSSPVGGPYWYNKNLSYAEGPRDRLLYSCWSSQKLYNSYCTTNPIWKSLQYETDPEGHSRSSELLLLARLCHFLCHLLVCSNNDSYLTVRYYRIQAACVTIPSVSKRH